MKLDVSDRRFVAGGIFSSIPSFIYSISLFMSDLILNFECTSIETKQSQHRRSSIITCIYTYIIVLEITMKRHMTVVAVAAQLLLASTFVLIESLSTRNLVAKTPSRTRFQSSSSRNDNKLVFFRHASSLSRIDFAFNSRLFSSSDMSSHPYSVYYGSSGSTAAQNFDQHDHANDVYGYGSRSHNDREGEGEQEGSHRNIQSVQDRSLVGGRRGAQLFGTNYIDTNNNNNIIYNNDPPSPPRPRHVEESHGRSLIEEEDMYMDNLHMMDHGWTIY